jgi:lipoic acid synthetase
MIQDRTTSDERRATKRPPWIRGKLSWDPKWEKVRALMDRLKLNSVCVEAACPNRGECWDKEHVTFMILGDICTRRCLFCNVKEGSPEPVEPSEPEKVAQAVKELGTKYVVITSVTRDDLPDEGAGHFVNTVREIRTVSEDMLVELLIPDLGGDEDLLRKIAFSGADVIGHNIEMPEALYGKIRPRSGYSRSLEVLKKLGQMRDEGAGISVKSSIMLGLGETDKDILKTLKDLKGAGVDIVYIGQYLSPSKEHWPCARYYTPDEFTFWENKAKELGFRAVLAGPMVRSSYRAREAYIAASART